MDVEGVSFLYIYVHRARLQEHREALRGLWGLGLYWPTGKRHGLASIQSHWQRRTAGGRN